MKKTALFMGLLAVASLCLTACGNSKDFTMSFDEAVNTANHSALQDILSQNDDFEQNFVIAGNYDADGTKIDANISSTSKQSLTNKNSESSTNFGVNITSEGETIKADGALDIKVVDNAIYLNILSLDLTGSEDVSMVTMMAEGFKNQWFVIPMTGLNDMPNTFSVLKDSKNLNEKAKEIIINEGSSVYNGKFEQFNGYNAWKFSLDNEKLNALIKEYYDTISNEENMVEIPEINIQNFEGYLVITGKDKVTTVIENMEIVEDETKVSVNGFGGENYEINMLSEGETLLTFVANKKGSDYTVSLNFTDSLKLEGVITTKVSSSKIELSFDVALTVESDYEETDDTIIPLKGSRKYSPISEFSIVAPEDAQDLTEMLGSYLGGMFGGSDYDYDYDYEDYDYGDYENYYDELGDDVESLKVAELEELEME